MQNRLPETIVPLHLADKRGELHGQIPLKQFSRLTENLVNNEGIVDVDLYFGREGRLAKIDGNLKTTLQLECQKCLEAVEFKVNHNVKLGIATSYEQVERLPETVEPLLLEEETILLIDLVEDELLLNLPDYPKHAYDCIESEIIKQHNAAFEEVVKTKPNPFSVLANLLENPNGSTKE